MKHIYIQAPTEWPSVWRWLTQSRKDALSLFPERVYREPRVDHSIFGRRLVVLSEPNAIYHVCGPASKHYRLSNLHLRMLRPALGDGLIVAEGKSWAWQRRLAMRLMPRRLSHERTMPIQARISKTIDGWGNNSSKQIHSDILLNELMSLSIDLIASSVFEYDCSVAHEGIIRAINNHRSNIENPDLFDVLGVPSNISSPRMACAHKIAHAYDDEIAWHTSKAQGNAHLRERAGSDIEVRRDFVVSMITGFESITTTTIWMLTILAQYPEIQERVRDDIVKQNFNAIGTLGDIAETYFDAVLRETLRLYPPLPLIFRVASQNDETPAGRIYSGTMVCISPFIVHRHHCWWQDSDQFIPERHMKLLEYPSAFMPFGLGVRRCVGQNIGANLVKQIIAGILARYRVAKNIESMPPPRAGVSLRPRTPFLIKFSTL